MIFPRNTKTPQEAIARGIKKMGAQRTTPVILGPVTWVHLSRHADAQASEAETDALKKQYLDAVLPVYKVSSSPRGGREGAKTSLPPTSGAVLL